MSRVPSIFIEQIFAGICVLENSPIQRALRLLFRALIGSNLHSETSSEAVL